MRFTSTCEPQSERHPHWHQSKCRKSARSPGWRHRLGIAVAAGLVALTIGGSSGAYAQVLPDTEVTSPGAPSDGPSDMPKTGAVAAANQAAPRRVSGSNEAIVITINLAATAQLPRIDADKTAPQVTNSVINASRPWFSDVSNGVFSGYFALRRGPYTVTTTATPCTDAWLKEIGDQANEGGTPP